MENGDTPKCSERMVTPMLELQNDRLVFSAPEVHLEARFTINFQRTLRIPDDDKEYPLPPGLGSFPLRHVDDFKDRVPAKWNEHGGVMLPMFQSEALWVQFSGHHVRRQGVYPFAVKLSAGKVSAVTGDDWEKGLKAKDYMVVPQQPWLDGYVVEEGVIRQFIAAPLGSGFTAEEQITGKAQHGGIQIEVFPMKREVFDRRFPKQPEQRPSFIRSMSLFSGDAPIEAACNYVAASADMGLAAGGRMKQQIFEDPYGLDDWDTEHGSRCFVHLANSLVWKAITKQDPPYPPTTAADYTARGFPWFDYYSDDWKSLAGTGKLKGLKSLLELGFQKGLNVLPENISVDFKSDQIKVLGDKRPNEVRAGDW
jgi:hypothetical protein